jgi:hypothetical protein
MFATLDWQTMLITYVCLYSNTEPNLSSLVKIIHAIKPKNYKMFARSLFHYCTKTLPQQKRHIFPRSALMQQFRALLLSPDKLSERKWRLRDIRVSGCEVYSSRDIVCMVINPPPSTPALLRLGNTSFWTCLCDKNNDKSEDQKCLTYPDILCNIVLHPMTFLQLRDYH